MAAALETHPTVTISNPSHGWPFQVSHDDTELWLADFNTAHHLLAGGSLTMTGGKRWTGGGRVLPLRCGLTWKMDQVADEVKHRILMSDAGHFLSHFVKF